MGRIKVFKLFHFVYLPIFKLIKFYSIADFAGEYNTPGESLFFSNYENLLTN